MTQKIQSLPNLSSGRILSLLWKKRTEISSSSSSSVLSRMPASFVSISRMNSSTWHRDWFQSLMLKFQSSCLLGNWELKLVNGDDEKACQIQPERFQSDPGLSLHPFALKPCRRAFIGKNTRFDRASPRTVFEPEAKVLVMKPCSFMRVIVPIPPLGRGKCRFTPPPAISFRTPITLPACSPCRNSATSTPGL